MKSGISLLEGLEHGRYEACLLATYNFYPPFFESVLLPKLEAVGCRYVAVLVDARQLSGTLQDESARPRHAGRDYVLVPIHMPGGRAAFHPKIALMGGYKDGRLFIGSHNLTVSGLTANREVSNLIEIDPGDRRSAGLQAARVVWDGLAPWWQRTPQRARAYLEEMSHALPWLHGPGEVAEDQFTVLVSRPNGGSLWSSVRQRLSGRVRRALIVGAFFDEALEFVRTLAQDLRPRQTIVGVDPRSVEINVAAAQRFTGARFVDASGIGDGRGYLHAKLIGLELEGGQEILISGSANPSAPAWLADEPRRNAEAVVVRQGKAGSLLESLGLTGLAGEKELARGAWSEVARRVKVRASRVDDTPHSSVTLAVQEDEALWIDATPLPRSAVASARIELSGGTRQEKAGAFKTEGEGFRVPLSATSERLLLVRLRHRSGEESLALPYDPTTLAERSQTGIQRALRQAMAALNAGVPEFEELLRLVEKAVFAPPEGQRDLVTPARRRGAAVAGEEPNAASKGQDGSLGRDLEGDTHRRRRLRQSSLPSDLVALLDALIQGLGRDLAQRGAASPGSDESDEEMGVGGPPANLGPRGDPVEIAKGMELAEHCQRKVTFLLSRRLLPRLEKVFDGEDRSAYYAAAQAAAVLKLVEAIVCQERSPPAPIPRGATLVDRSALGEFLWDASRLLCHPEQGILGRALREVGLSEVEEVSATRGMLIWFAWTAGIDVRWADRGEDRDAVREQELALSDLLLILLDSSGDRLATKHAREALARTCGLRELQQVYAWLDRHLAWRDAIQMASQGSSTRISRRAVPGDIVVVTKQAARPRLVVEAYPGVVVVADPDHEGGMLRLGERFVEVVDVRRTGVSVA